MDDRNNTETEDTETVTAVTTSRAPVDRYFHTNIKSQRYDWIKMMW